MRNAVIPATYELLPSKMDTPESRALLLAIGLQESEFSARRQYEGGPAKGFWQFERSGGVRGVLTHPASRSYITPILQTLLYADDALECHEAIEHNDILACVFARLLLWTDPKALPKADDADGAWHYYSRNWRPGRPHRDKWDDNHEQAWALV